jgi:plastocyanin
LSRDAAKVTLATDYQLQRRENLDMRRILAAALLLVAAAPALAQQAPVTITIRDNQFVPAEVEIPAGVKAELVIRNEKATAAEFESKSLRREKVIAPGATASIFVGPLKPGRYEFYDEFHETTRGFLVVK